MAGESGSKVIAGGVGIAWLSSTYEFGQRTVFCAKNKSYVDKTEFKAVMEAIRTFLALPVRTVQEGHSFTKTWKPLALKRFQCTSFTI